MQIIAVSGSLRKRSFNTALLRAAADLAPSGMSVSRVSIEDVPLYNPELDETMSGGPYPDSVRRVIDAVRESDGLILGVPEYNWGPTGVIKNIVDWLSRPANASPLYHKPIALMGTSPGPAGTGRAQLQLRQNLLSTRSHVLIEPEVQLGGANKLFNDELKLVDPDSREAVAKQLDAFAEWIELHRVEIDLDLAERISAATRS